MRYEIATQHDVQPSKVVTFGDKEATGQDLETPDGVRDAFKLCPKPSEALVPCVQALDAACQRMDDACLAAMLSSIKDECSHVYLWDNRIGDPGFCTLVDAVTTRAMKVLWMGHNHITSRGLCYLCKQHWLYCA